MRVLLYLKSPDIEIVVIVDEPAPVFGSAHGRAVFSAAELDAVLSHSPTPAEFRVICAAKLAFNGVVDHEPDAHLPPSGYGDDDALYL